MRPSADLAFNSQSFPTAALALQTQIILVRHGRSTFNDEGRYQGSSDASMLTAIGQQTAAQIGIFLETDPIHTVYTSPLRRVRQTAEVILANMAESPRLETHPNLREIDMHHWEGQSFQQIRENYKADYECWKQRPHEFQLETFHHQAAYSTATTLIRNRCFPVIDLYERVQQFWQEVLPRHLGQTILIVSHGGTNRALISTALGLAPAQFHSLQQSNCGISRLQLPTGSLKSSQLTALNLTTPIGETLPKLKEGKTGLRLLLLSSEKAASMPSLTALLKTVAIDFSLTSVSESAQSITEQILEYHSETIQLQTHHDRFLSTWQHTITAKYQQAKGQHFSQLITGLVVAESADIQQIIGQAIGLNSEQIWRIQIQPGSLSVLHYPAAHQSPVLQALNFA
jgi:probable phosphoglycerate mutase